MRKKESNMIPNPLFPKPTNSLMIAGNAGILEAIVSPPETEISPIIAIICHPHPLHGGTMHNKVISTVARTFHELGIWSIRFNFRGVGLSQGHYDQGDGETDDLIAVMHWAKTQFPNHDIWLSGFSFGAYIAIKGATQQAFKDKIKQLITIAPAVNHFEFSDNQAISCAWTLLMGEKDEIVPTNLVKNWIITHGFSLIAIYFPEVGHFFHGHLTALKEQLKMTLGTKTQHTPLN